MRSTFVETVTELARKDKKVWLVTGDLGFSVFEPFAKEFPNQYLNVGVAEQNLMGVAAGLAMAGLRPFVYSITTFASMRAYEQIRDDICYQNVPVVVVGGGSTFSYSTFGATHMPLEDMALMRVMPNMTVFSPGDPNEVRELLRTAYKSAKPSYMRIAKKGEPIVPGGIVEAGTMRVVKEGNDATIVVSGRQLPSAVEAADMLAKKNIRARVLSAHTLKPFDAAAVRKAAKETRAIVSVEEHSVIGGLASAIAETLIADAVPFKPLGVTDEFPKGVGSQDYFLAKYGLTPDGIARTVMTLIS
jgi:transketolase